MEDQIYYPEYNNSNFNNIINKYEFNDVNNKTHIYQTPRQLLVRNFISKNTIYDNILLFWSTGVGKSGAAISIAEGFKEYSSNMNRKIVVLVKNDNIRKNFISELVSDFTRNDYLDKETKMELHNKYTSKERKGEIMNKMVRLINKTYNFITYGSFVTQVLGAKKFQKENGFSTKKFTQLNGKLLNLNNSVIIIDEVHNVTNNPTYIALEKVLRNSYNYRLVLLTATPMYDNPKEMIEITNLLNMNSPELLLPIRNDLFKSFNGNYIFEKNDPENLGLIKGNIINITNYGKELLKTRLMGKISYLESNIDKFPEKINIGTKLMNEIGSTNIIECEMSEYQTNIYNVALNEDLKIKTVNLNNINFSDNNQNEDGIEDNENNINTSSSLFHNSSSASVFVYPNNKYGKEGFLDVFEKKSKNKYSIKSQYINILKKDNDLERHSSKFYNLLNNIELIKNEPGNIFIYSNYVEFNGTELLKQLLLNNGYKKFINIESSSGQLNFVLYDSSDTAETRDKLRNIYNSPENKNGKYIKIIIGSPIISEGITLKNTRQVHILEPAWNMSKINQIIGRAARYNSHNDLDEQYKNVNIYKYCSIPSNNIGSIDKQKYILSEYKDRSNKEIERLLKEVAFDCFINENPINKIENSPECDYTKCNYVCDVKLSNLDKIKKDKSTYQLYIDFFSKFDIEYITLLIKELFSTYFIWSIDDIIQKIKEKADVSNESIFTTLNNIIENKVIITDLYKREGFLINKDIYIIFNPLKENINSSIFSKVLDFEEYTNKYTLEQFVNKKFGENENIQTVDVKQVKKKFTVELSPEDIIYNDQIIKNNLLYGHYRSKGIGTGNFGEIDDKFRIVDSRDVIKEDQEDDKRKNITGMNITSLTKPQLFNIIEYFDITSKIIFEKQYIKFDKEIDTKKLGKIQLSQIIQSYLEENHRILR